MAFLARKPAFWMESPRRNDTTQVVGELNSTGNDSPTWISDDECTILLARSPDDTTSDLYVAHRPH
jgi:hypothetical protein